MPQRLRLLLTTLVVALLIGRIGDGKALVVYQLHRHPSDQPFLPLSLADDYRCSDCNVILISIDTLRPDHLGIYGYDKPTSPNIDRFSGDAVRFATAASPGPSTLVSHGAVFTSRLPSQNNAAVRGRRPLPAEVLSADGFRTGALTGGGQMNAGWGVDQGFDLYRSKAADGDRLRTLFEILPLEEGFLDEAGSDRFFLLLHTYEVHAPYRAEAKYLRRFEPPYRGRLPGDLRPMDLLKSINNDLNNLS